MATKHEVMTVNLHVDGDTQVQATQLEVSDVGVVMSVRIGNVTLLGFPPHVERVLASALNKVNETVEAAF